jgi:flagellar hook-associated protein 1
MSSLFGALNLGRQGIEVSQYALELTQRNIANVNTPGYSRQRVNLIPGGTDGTTSGLAVTIGAVDSFRDRFLDYRITSELEQQGKYDAESSTLEQVEALLNETSGEGLQSALSSFFNSLGKLGAAPEEMTLRSQVLSSATELARQIQRLSNQFNSIRYSQDEAVKGTIDKINTFTSRIADLNAQISGSTDTTGSTSILRDQRQQALEQLSSLVDLSYFETESGAVTVSTRGGALLVVGNQNYEMEGVPSSSLLQVMLDGRNVTSQIKGGQLGGLLEVRDTKLPGYLGQLDEMAGRLIERVNAIHAGGNDYNGAAGGDFFVPFTSSVPGSYTGAAGSIAVAITDPRKIAAAAAGAGTGNNENALKLAAVADEKLFASGTASTVSFYSVIVFSVASDSSSASQGSSTERHILTQLQNQRDAASGVSLDEEAANLILFQKAFEASARFIQSVDEMTDVLVKMLG